MAESASRTGSRHRPRARPKRCATASALACSRLAIPWTRTPALCCSAGIMCSIAKNEAPSTPQLSAVMSPPPRRRARRRHPAGCPVQAQGTEPASRRHPADRLAAEAGNTARQPAARGRARDRRYRHEACSPAATRAFPASPRRGGGRAPPPAHARADLLVAAPEKCPWPPMGVTTMAPGRTLGQHAQDAVLARVGGAQRPSRTRSTPSSVLGRPSASATARMVVPGPRM